jgi:hypothetical protein
MRTTLSLDDDIFRAVRNYAEGRSLSLGRAVSDLVRRGLAARTPTKVVNGLVVFDVPPDTPPITSERIMELESEMDEETWSRS